jgi:hypothetical protein
MSTPQISRKNVPPSGPLTARSVVFGPQNTQIRPKTRLLLFFDPDFECRMSVESHRYGNSVVNKRNSTRPHPTLWPSNSAEIQPAILPKRHHYCKSLPANLHIRPKTSHLLSSAPKYPLRILTHFGVRFLHRCLDFFTQPPKYLWPRPNSLRVLCISALSAFKSVTNNHSLKSFVWTTLTLTPRYAILPSLCSHVSDLPSLTTTGAKD